ncbi:MAG: acetamidase/formamidase family protein [Neisseriaceae bacterium]|nr:acetamidase/formamidase family protein [Neisseriaceae bacterium]MBP6862417.1 acetamidase/formamidase family protein [Neisseriaceae bacterium]
MHTLRRQNAVIYAFDKHTQPALTVAAGERVCIETYDCFEDQIDAEHPATGVDWARINPATGPIYIKGAEKGDVLKVHIERIEVANSGVLVAGAGLGIMGHRLEGMTQKVVAIEDEHVVFNERLRIPLNKMIGVIGVAPAGDPIPCGVPDTHGGNMDTKLITEGATLYLPVFNDGALFALGDFHAAMGDGEIGVSGVEIAGQAVVKLDLIKQRPLAHPVVENADQIAFLASKATLDEAIKTATESAVVFVQQATGLSLAEATMLMSAAGNAEISQIVDPLMTARFGVPKYLLAAYGVSHFG